MKKLTYLLFLAIGVTACSVESMDSTENLLTADAKVKIQEVGKSMSLKAVEICEGEAPVFVFNFPQNMNGPHLANTDIKIQKETSPGSGVWDEFEDITYSGSGQKEYTYEDEVMAIGTYSFRAKIGNGGFDYLATLTVKPCPTCTNSLEVDFVCGETNTATFTFTAEEAGPIVIQGGLNRWAEISEASSNMLARNTTHPSVINSSSSVTRWEGTVEACQVVTVTIEFSGGNEIGDWTAKRGDDVLGATDAQSCIN